MRDDRAGPALVAKPDRPPSTTRLSGAARAHSAVPRWAAVRSLVLVEVHEYVVALEWELKPNPRCIAGPLGGPVEWNVRSLQTAQTHAGHESEDATAETALELRPSKAVCS